MNYTFFALSNASKMLASLVPNVARNGAIASESEVAQAANATGWGYVVDAPAESFSNVFVECAPPPPAPMSASPTLEAGVLLYGNDVNSTSISAFSANLCDLVGKDQSMDITPFIIVGMFVALACIACATPAISRAKNSLTSWCSSFSQSNEQGPTVDAASVNDTTPLYNGGDPGYAAMRLP